MAGAARADAPVLYGVAEPGEPIGKLRRARSPARPRRARRRRRRRQPQSLTAMRVSSLSALAAALVALLPAPALAPETSSHTYAGLHATVNAFRPFPKLFAHPRTQNTGLPVEVAG